MRAQQFAASQPVVSSDGNDIPARGNECSTPRQLFAVRDRTLNVSKFSDIFQQVDVLSRRYSKSEFLANDRRLSLAVQSVPVEISQILR